MIEKAGNIFCNRLLYISVLMAIIMFDTVLIVHNYTGPAIKIFLLWGALIFLWDFIHEKKLLGTKPLICLAVFSALYGVTIIINPRQYWVDNIKTWIYMVLFFVMLYGHDVKADISKWRKEVRTIMMIFIIVSAMLSAICMMTFVFQINFARMTVDGYMHVGMYDNRLWGLYNPNIGGCINLISIFFSLGMMMSLENRGKFKIAGLSVNILLQYFCLLLTGSRTSLYTFLICLAGFLFLIFNLIVPSFSIKTLKGFLLNLIVAAFLVGAVYMIGNPIKNMLAYVPVYAEKYVGSYEQKTGFKDDENLEEIDKVELTRLEVLENRSGGVLTGRLYIWEAGIKAWMKSPIFGISKNAIYDFAKEFIEDEKWLQGLSNSLHNGYITVLTASGVVGAVVFCVFLIMNLIPMVWCALCRVSYEKYILFATCLTIVISLLIVECFEARILYRTDIFAVVFWIMCGMAYNYVEIVKENEEANIV